MVDQLAAEYSDQNVVFLEYDVDSAPPNREGRWWAGYGGGSSVYLPLVMVDSGYLVSNGPENFYNVYKVMVDASLQRPPAARLEVERERVGDSLHYQVTITNHSGGLLTTGNSATLHVLVYDDASTGVTDRQVVATNWVPIIGLADGDTQTLNVQVPVADANWDQIRSVVLVDYKPAAAGGAFDTVQAVMGE